MWDHYEFPSSSDEINMERLQVSKDYDDTMYSYDFALDTTEMAQLLKDRDDKNRRRRRVQKTVMSDKLLRAKQRYRPIT